jgi:hypothetical protein
MKLPAPLTGKSCYQHYVDGDCRFLRLPQKSVSRRTFLFVKRVDAFSAEDLMIACRQFLP